MSVYVCVPRLPTGEIPQQKLHQNTWSREPPAPAVRVLGLVGGLVQVPTAGPHQVTPFRHVIVARHWDADLLLYQTGVYLLSYLSMTVFQKASNSLLLCSAAVAGGTSERRSVCTSPGSAGTRGCCFLQRWSASLCSCTASSRWSTARSGKHTSSFL